MGILIDRNVELTVAFGMEPGDGGDVNRVYYRRLGFGDMGAIQQETTRMSMKFAGKTAGEAEIAVTTIQQMIAVLKTAVTGWEGPLFEGVRYRKSIWDDLDIAECEWWVTKVHSAVNGTNSARTTAPENGSGEGADPLEQSTSEA